MSPNSDRTRDLPTTRCADAERALRPHRLFVERYREAAPWRDLELEAATELVDRVAELPSAVRDDDEEAKRFDLILLRLQLCRLRHEPGQERLRRQVQEIATGLLEQLAIPAIREQQVLLTDLAGDEWWIDVTLPMLERVRRRVRGLVRLLEKRRRIIVYADFVDELGDVVEVELRGVPVGTDFERFREKARVYLREHEEHVALQKLRRNRPLTGTDLDELERMLQEAGIGGARELERAIVEGDGLGVFIRSLVGLDRDAATDALAAFIDGRTLTADQHDFVALVVEHLTMNGGMHPRLLYESPFTDIVRWPRRAFPQRRCGPAGGSTRDRSLQRAPTRRSRVDGDRLRDETAGAVPRCYTRRRADEVSARVRDADAASARGARAAAQQGSESERGRAGARRREAAACRRRRSRGG